MRVGCVILLAVVLAGTASAQRHDPPTALEKVHVLAGTHRMTVTKRGAWYWVEVEGSDIFGTGTTPELAAEDFLADADLEAHEANRPALKRRGHGSAIRAEKPDCSRSECI